MAGDPLVDFRNALLGPSGRLIGADNASMMDWAKRGAGDETHENLVACLGIRGGLVERFVEGRNRYDRSLGKMLRAMRGGRPVIDSDVYSSRDRRELVVYRELFLPQGATSILAAEVHGRSTFIVFKRHGRASPFRQRDVSALEALLPLIALADAGGQYRLEARRPEGRLLPPLTRREVQVASLASRGMRNVEIAALLGTSVETTKKQLKNVFVKAQVSNRTELAMLWAASS